MTQFPFTQYIEIIWCVKRDTMISIVFKELDKSGVFTGNVEQFCSERCAEEWEQQGLAFGHYVDRKSVV